MIPKWLRLVRSNPTKYEKEILQSSPVCSSENVINLLRPRFIERLEEEMITVLLNSRNQVIGMVSCGVGSVSSISLRIGDIFRVACAAGANGIILSHNHPSGDSTPSGADDIFTRKVKEAGEILGINLIDHVIIAGSESYSYLDRGKI